jgi:pimeloyl-ACP methyl ester carboxylesterase
MSTVISEDGTLIAFSGVGHGPPLILVDGALCYRQLGNSVQLAKLLATSFTVYTYDRRGRGESGDAGSYAVSREIEDLQALLAAAGGSAAVWGISSGAVLALEAAKQLKGITKVAVYEAPFIIDDSRPTTEDDWARINDALRMGNGSAAAACFLKSVGVPGPLRLLLRLMPIWHKLVAIAPTLAYDGAIVEANQKGKPLRGESWASIRIPVLVTDGGKSPRWIRRANEALAQVLPNAIHRTLRGQTHMLKAKAHSSVLTEFFKLQTKEVTDATFDLEDAYLD